MTASARWFRPAQSGFGETLELLHRRCAAAQRAPAMPPRRLGPALRTVRLPQHRSDDDLAGTAPLSRQCRGARAAARVPAAKANARSDGGALDRRATAPGCASSKQRLPPAPAAAALA